MLKPLHNKVVIRPDKPEKETASGIIIPEESLKEKAITGVVVVGNDTVKENDRVLFSKFGFDELEMDGETLFVVSEACLLAILT